MSIVRSVSFPEELIDIIDDQIEQTRGASFSGFVVSLVIEGLNREKLKQGDISNDKKDYNDQP